jgi:spore coat protein A, manganese oxidase
MRTIRWKEIGISLLFALFILAALACPPLAAQEDPDRPTLNASDIPKFINELAGPPPVYVSETKNGTESYVVRISQSTQQILPRPLPRTQVWSYGGMAMDALSGRGLGVVSSTPGPTFEVTRGTPVLVEWRNAIGRHVFPVDPTLHWADPNEEGLFCCNGSSILDTECSGTIDCDQPFPPGFNFAQRPVPLVTHLHGGEVPSASDGNPEAWWTVNGERGQAYRTYERTGRNATVYYYPNEQPATTLWYHDHALGITRLNVMSGLAGLYLIRDPGDATEQALDDAGLNHTKYEMPLVIQDREFNRDGSLWMPEEGNSPADHPYWNPEFFGEVIAVNGKVWPRMDVDRGVYRFRFLDGSNARFYTLSFDNGMEFTQIGVEGGYLKEPVTLDEITIAPGERADVLVDFSSLPEGTEVILTNSAPTPYPDGDPVSSNAAVVMKFIVTAERGPEMPDLPSCLNPTLCDGYPSLPEPNVTRNLVLMETMNMTNDEPVMLTLNGQRWMANVTEMPREGATEDWILINPTVDAHPIHLHLVQFQLVGRIRMDTESYAEDWLELNRDNLTEQGHSEEEVAMMPPWPLDYQPEELNISDYVEDSESPDPEEMGWKDTIIALPGYATVIRSRFSPIDGSPEYPFNVTEGPGYVWHCHILDHEDNEMMRPYIVTASP